MDDMRASTGTRGSHLLADPGLIDARPAARRLLATLALVILGSSPIYVLSVMQPEVQRAFGISAVDVSLSYTLMMISLGLGGVLCGRWADRYGVARVLSLGAAGLCTGYMIAGLASNSLVFAVAHGLLLGLLAIGSSFVPLIADTALWWHKRRGLAVSICMSGNAIAGMVWPPMVQWGITHVGWRQTYVALGLICGLGMALLSKRLRQRLPMAIAIYRRKDSTQQAGMTPAGLSMNAGPWLLLIATISCCAAMAIPQQHLIAFGLSLGIDAGQGAALLSVMLVFKSVGRLASGWISDHIGGPRTLVLGLLLQAFALASFLPVEGVASLYVVSAMLGFFLGGIVPSFVLIVRDYFSAAETGTWVGVVMLGVQLGLALGGWMSEELVSLTGSYQAAFLSGVGWNLLGIALIATMLIRLRQRQEK
jgi:MFS family permease